MFSPEWTIRFHTILIGASKLIPIPFLDTLISFYLRRHLVSELAKKHQRRLSRAEIYQLAIEQSAGCMGVLTFLIILPLKELYQEVTFWLEWKRGIDLATQTYYFGYLVNALLVRDDFDPQKVPIYRQAINESLLGFQTDRLRDIVKQTFSSSRTVIRAVRRWLFQFVKYYLKLLFSFPVKKGRQFISRFRRRKDIESARQNDYAERLDDFFEESRPQISNLSESLSNRLEGGIEKLPGHFEQLTRRLDERLAFYANPGNLSSFLSTKEQ